MSDERDGLGSMSAFPIVVDEGLPAMGLSKRELFAAMAMQALLASGARVPQEFDGSSEELLARAAAVCADALLAELAKERKTD